jgi:hypothetical protein
MGREIAVQIDEPAGVTWPAIRQTLLDHGVKAELRMADGELTYPADDPPESWREIRVSFEKRMVTVQRRENVIALVTWGDADLETLAFRNALAWAIAQKGPGVVLEEGNAIAPGTWYLENPLPTGWHGAAR